MYRAFNGREYVRSTQQNNSRTRLQRLSPPKGPQEGGGCVACRPCNANDGWTLLAYDSLSFDAVAISRDKKRPQKCLHVQGNREEKKQIGRRDLAKPDDRRRHVAQQASKPHFLCSSTLANSQNPTAICGHNGYHPNPPPRHLPWIYIWHGFRPSLSRASTTAAR